MSFEQDRLMRFTLQDAVITADTAGKNDGRGFYLCKDSECLEKAIRKKAFERICRSKVDKSMIMRAFEDALDAN
jgi:hypothetical protein